MRNDRLMHRTDQLTETFVALGMLRPGEVPSEAQIEQYFASTRAARGVAAHDAGRAPVLVNDSRWLATCDAEHPILGLPVTPGQIAVTCPECGATYQLDWPDDVDLARIEVTLLARPARLPRDVDPGRNVATRCWHPGETVDDLERETATLAAAIQERARRKEGV